MLYPRERKRKILPSRRRVCGVRGRAGEKIVKEEEKGRKKENSIPRNTVFVTFRLAALLRTC